MKAWFACTGSELLADKPENVVGRLASAQQARGLAGTPDQEAAWYDTVGAIRKLIAERESQNWTIAFEYELLRLEKRIDAVVLTDDAIFCLEFKHAEPTAVAVAEAEDYALDLRDFHERSRTHPIVPVLVAGMQGWAPPRQPWLLATTPTEPVICSAATLGACFDWVLSVLPIAAVPIDGRAWLAAAYRPVPTIVEAAKMLYARNSVGEIATARADATNLTRTADAIANHIERARSDHAKTVVFVTGIPGAGKTLCGLNAVFGPSRHDGAAFLTGNAPLVAVLREALIRDAVLRGECGRSEAERRTKTALQNVHRFLEDNATAATKQPPERLIVFDEAQRAWDEAKARIGTQNKRSLLTLSEPAHTLEIMGRRDGWSVIVALIGNGQEINTGEAGLAEWGHVIAANPAWRAAAAPRVLEASDSVQRLANGPAAWLTIDPELDLTVPIRSIRDSAGAGWVAAVLDGDAGVAGRIAGESQALPYFVTRDLVAMRQGLRALARGQRRAGLVRSAGARRLRAEGLAAEVTADEVPNWFLNSWPDIRASDALEAAATEYACQGLELDVVGVAWGGDFIRSADGWRARRFAGHSWQRATAYAAFTRNTYRVLLTRARYETIIWVPRGSPEGESFFDATRPAAEMDAIAAFLQHCGARSLDDLPKAAPPASEIARLL